MTALTATHLSLLRAALGLSHYVKVPTRDWLPQADEDAHPAEVDELVQLGFLRRRTIPGPSPEPVIEITSTGRAAVTAARQATPPAAPPQPQPRNETMEATTTKKPRKKAATAPEPDIRTGDLLAGADEKRSTPPFDLAPAAPDQSGKPGPLALATLQPAEYVAQVYQPFNARFDQLKAEAKTILLDPAALDALPETERATYTVLDLTTRHGMDAAIKYRAAFRDEVRLAATHAHKDRKAPILEIGRLLDAKKNEIIAAVEPYETRFDAAIKAEEKRKEEEKLEAARKEAERVAAIRARIDAITALATQHANEGSAALAALGKELAQRSVTVEEFAEFADEAALAIETTAGALLALYDGALARENAEAERIRKAEEERKRLDEQAEANRIEAERLAAERAQAEQAQQAAEAAAAQLKAMQEQQQRTMEAVKGLNDLGVIEGDARKLSDALAGAQAWTSDETTFGAGAAMVTMARDMAIKTLEQRYAQALADELPAAHAEALEDNARFDAERDAVQALESAPEPGFFDGIDESEVVTYMPDGSLQALQAAPAPVAEAAPEPAPLPEPEAYSPIDEHINIGEAAEPSDDEIIAMVGDHYGWDYRQTVDRLALIRYDARARA